MGGTVLLKNNYVAFKPDYIISNLRSIVKCFVRHFSRFSNFAQIERLFCIQDKQKEQFSPENCSLLYIMGTFLDLNRIV